VVLQIPLSNAQARSKYAQARIELEQEQARRRDLVAQITLEVGKSLGDLESNFKRVQTTKRARELAKKASGARRLREVRLVTLKM
jgi:outer membrane protein TolC